MNKNLNLIHIIKDNNINENIITSIGIFPSGNFICVSSDKSIKIYNENFILIEYINNSHNDKITFVDVKDENNFVTCSCDKNIKTWIKRGNKFEENKIIRNAHKLQINKVLFYGKNIISCSNDNLIKVWEENNNNNYQSNIIFKHLNSVCAILLLNEKNILVSSGLDGTKIWNLNNCNFIFSIDETWCASWNGLCKINNDEILVQEKDDFSFKIISISQRKVIKAIECNHICFGLISIEDKGIIIIGDESIIRLYNSKNYNLMKIITNAHEKYIIGFQQLKNGLIISYSYDKTLKIWSYE